MKPIDTLIIKDNFYADPDNVRELALRKTFKEPPGDSAKLARSVVCDEQEFTAMCKGLEPYVDPSNIVNVSVLFRYTLKGAQKKVFCHVDHCSYAGIVYLALPEHCAGGTTFYRHLPTGDEIYKPENAHRYKFEDDTQWEVLREVDMVYNRLVMYSGFLFHSITPIFFGEDIENARLTQNVFIYKKGDIEPFITR